MSKESVGNITDKIDLKTEQKGVVEKKKNVLEIIWRGIVEVLNEGACNEHSNRGKGLT
jgi:hypothetical protein